MDEGMLVKQKEGKDGKGWMADGKERRQKKYGWIDRWKKNDGKEGVKDGRKVCMDG